MRIGSSNVVSETVMLPSIPWVDITSTMAFVRVVGQMQPKVGMNNGNATVTKVTDKSIILVTTAGRRVVTGHFTIDDAEARRHGWVGNSRMRARIADVSSAEDVRHVSELAGKDLQPIVIAGHSVVRDDVRLRGGSVLPVYSIDGGAPVCIEEAARLLGADET